MQREPHETLIPNSTAPVTESLSFVPNSDILHDDIKQFPPTISDLVNSDNVTDKTDYFDLNYFVKEKLHIPIAWDNSRYIRSLLDFLPSHPDLQISCSEKYHDVYICVIPRPLYSAPLKHFSIYTQGRFFQLRNKKTPELDISSSYTVEELDTLLNEIREDVDRNRFHLRGKEGDTMNSNNPYRAIAIYHVGQTQFDINMVTDISRWLITKFRSYNFYDKNCQMFALSLMERIVMTKQAGTLFVGTRVQIVNWDVRLKAKPEEEWPYRQELGYLVHKPGSVLPSRVLSLDHILRMIRTGWVCAGVGALYQKGPAHAAACDPAGRKNRISYHVALNIEKVGETWQLALKDFREECSIALADIKEQMQDLCVGNFRQAWQGRDETRKKRYKRYLLRTQGTDRYTKWNWYAKTMIAFEKGINYITDEEEKEVLREIEEEKGA